jgi:DNA-binding ferritin-like protein
MNTAFSVSNDATILFDDLLHENHGMFAILTVAKYLSELYRTNHWSCKGRHFYSQHELYGKLYEACNAEVDSIAEKLLYSNKLNNSQVNITKLNNAVCKVSNYVNNNFLQVVSTEDTMLKKVIFTEEVFLYCIAYCIESLKFEKLFTRGIDNLLAGIEDIHEKNLYLLYSSESSQL